ncbi:DUF1573 domain-containing protein [Ascidiimonas sp. W6]|uniref:DUF1573 domain-containing protein n=1 Tax=Ascidiimonas meishanensis TaxID=3128903 RepID=UPI0030EBAA2C
MSQKEPIIIVKNDSLILQNLHLGDTVSFDIQLENKGTEAYQIQNILGSCGCLNFDYSIAREIPPGNQFKIPVDFVAKKKGSFENTITIKGNTKPSFTVFNFSGKVIDLVSY